MKKVSLWERLQVSDRDLKEDEIFERKIKELEEEANPPAP